MTRCRLERICLALMMLVKPAGWRRRTGRLLSKALDLLAKFITFMRNGFVPGIRLLKSLRFLAVLDDQPPA